MYNENYQNSELVDDPEEAQSKATEVSMSADVEPMDFEYNPLSLFVDDQILEYRSIFIILYSFVNRRKPDKQDKVLWARTDHHSKLRKLMLRCNNAL